LYKRPCSWCICSETVGTWNIHTSIHKYTLHRPISHAWTQVYTCRHIHFTHTLTQMHICATEANMLTSLSVWRQDSVNGQNDRPSFLP